MTRLRFDWDLIRTFLAAMDHGSLLGAARALNSSQPTMGRHIAELESQLGTALFERTGRGLRPTATATALVSAAREMESGALRMAQSVTHAQTSVSGTVRITASTPVAYHLLPRILLDLRQTFPEIQVELVASNAVSNLLRREADIAVRMVPPAQSSLIARRVGQVTLGAYAHSAYLTRRGTPKTPQDLLAHTLIGFDRDQTLRRGFARLGLTVQDDAFAIRCDDFTAQWEMLRAGLGIGFVADYVARLDPQVQSILPTLKIPAIPVWLAVHREIRTSPRIRTVFDFLGKALPVALT